MATPVMECMRRELNESLGKVEAAFGADALAIYGPIHYQLDRIVKVAVESMEHESRRTDMVVILDTHGGIVQVVERMVAVVRNFYKKVYFVIPDKAMSAGTIFAMSGNKIFMDYFSCLGPIDPQVEVGGSMVSVLSYLNQYEMLKKKSVNGGLSQAEIVLLDKLDLGQLYEFDQSRLLSIDLLKRWLSTYKFEEWSRTEGTDTPVTLAMKVKRAEEIAGILSKNDYWHSHGRGIDIHTLRSDIIKLKIDDLNATPNKSSAIKDYHALIVDFMTKHEYPAFVHTRKYF